MNVIHMEWYRKRSIFYQFSEAGILESRGDVKVALHDQQGALEDFNRAHELDPCDVGILKSRGNVKVALDDHQGALEDFNRAHELDPCDVGILKSRGNVKVALHDHQGALEDFNRAHELDPCDVGILKSRGDVKVALHDQQGALEDFNRAHELDTCDVGILKSRGNVKVALHDHQGALEDFKSRGNVNVALHDQQGALEDFNRAHELDPCDVGILKSRGNVKAALHDHQGALEDFNRAHELDPCDVGILKSRGDVKVALHDHQGALEDFKSRGNVNVALHDHQGALEDFNRAHELDPCDVGILKSRGNVKVALHDHQGALEDFNRAHKLDPCDVGILKSRGDVKVALHDDQGALEDFNRAHELDPCDVAILKSRGDVKVALHDHRGALEDFNRALDPCDVGILRSRGNFKVALLDHQGALEDFDRAHDLDPCDVGILRSRGNFKVALLDHQGALEDFDRAHELDPCDVETLRLRGHVKRMMGDLKGSIMDWATAHGLPYDDIVRFGNRAFVKKRLENYDGKLNPKQEFEFLLSVKKLVLQLVVSFVVMVIFVFQYLIGYVERGRWGTYLNGTWEFRATYVCIELRLGSYPFQKFRERPPSCSYIGIRSKKRTGRNGKYTRYEPHLKLNNVSFYFRECKTRVKAAFIYDIAKLCLGVKDGKFNMLCPQRYNHLQNISVEKPTTTKEISKIVFQRAESTFQSIKDHPTDGDNQRILKLFEDGGEGCAMNENRASLDSNGVDDHVIESNMGLSTLEALPNSPYDGDVPAINIDEHAQDLGESTDFGMGLSRVEALWNLPDDGDVPAIDIDKHAQDLGESTGILETDIQYPSLPNGSLEPLRIQSPTVRGHSSFQFRTPPGLHPSLQEIFTKLRTFFKQKWRVALYRSAAPTSLNTVHQTVEGCSETSPLYLRLHKSGDIESISLSGEMVSELEVLYGCGWIEDRNLLDNFGSSPSLIRLLHLKRSKIVEKVVQAIVASSGLDYQVLASVNQNDMSNPQCNHNAETAREL
ncbi:unnamed protein product [Sphagnum tenellum]